MTLECTRSSWWRGTRVLIQPSKVPLRGGWESRRCQPWESWHRLKKAKLVKGNSLLSDNLDIHMLWGLITSFDKTPLFLDVSSVKICLIAFSHSRPSRTLELSLLVFHKILRLTLFLFFLQILPTQLKWGRWVWSKRWGAFPLRPRWLRLRQTISSR